MSQLPPGIDLSTVPLFPNPNGGPPEFDAPGRGDELLGVGIPLTVITLIIVAVRLTSNIKQTQKLGIEDWFCLSATVVMVAYFGLTASTIHTMKHAWQVPLSAFDASFVKISYVQNMIGCITQFLSKAAIITLYLRLFSPKRWLRWTCYALLVITFGVYTPMVPYASVVCTPRDGETWDIIVLQRCGARCIEISQVQGVFSIVIDFALLVIPLPIIHSLNLTPRRKIGLMIVFLVGIFAPIASIVNTYFRFTGFDPTDPLWQSSSLLICQYAEVYATIMISCAPALSSFWIHTVEPSAFYGSLKQTFTSSVFKSSPSQSYAQSGPGQGQYKRYGSSRDSQYDLSESQTASYELQQNKTAT